MRISPGGLGPRPGSRSRSISRQSEIPSCGSRRDWGFARTLRPLLKGPQGHDTRNLIFVLRFRTCSVRPLRPRGLLMGGGYLRYLVEEKCQPIQRQSPLGGAERDPALSGPDREDCAQRRPAKNNENGASLPIQKLWEKSPRPAARHQLFRATKPVMASSTEEGTKGKSPWPSATSNLPERVLQSREPS